jgi:hypothetical protein
MSLLGRRYIGSHHDYLTTLASLVTHIKLLKLLHHGIRLSHYGLNILFHWRLFLLEILLFDYVLFKDFLSPIKNVLLVQCCVAELLSKCVVVDEATDSFF